MAKRGGGKTVMVIDEFIIKLGVDASALQKGVAEIKQSVSKMTTGIGSIFEKSLSMWGKFIRSFLIVAVKTGVAAVGAAFALFIRDADRLGKSAKDIGVTVETLSALETVAKRAGGSTEELEKDMKSLAEETGGNAYGALKSLAEIADEMGETEYTTYAESLGLSRTTIDMTKEGTEAFKKQIIVAKELGIINRQVAHDAKEFKQAIFDLITAFRSIVAVGARLVLPAFKKVAEAMKKAVIFLRRNEQFVKFFFIGLAAVITATAIPAIIALGAAILASPITWMIAAVAALALALDDMFGWMDGKEAAWGDFWAQMWGTDDPEEAKQKFEELKNEVVDLFNSFTENLPTIKEMWEGLVEVVKILASPKGILALISAFETVKGGWESLKSTISSGIDFLIEKFVAFGKAIENALNPWAAKGQAIIGQTTPLSPEQTASAEEHKADGGIFTSPTNALIGEAGSEAVIPFSPGKRNRGIELLSKIAGNLMPNISASQALPMGGATTNNITTDTRVNVGTVNISAADGTDAANQFMSGIESRASAWTAAANVAY